VDKHQTIIYTQRKEILNISILYTYSKERLQKHNSKCYLITAVSSWQKLYYFSFLVLKKLNLTRAAKEFTIKVICECEFPAFQTPYLRSLLINQRDDYFLTTAWANKIREMRVRIPLT